MRSALRILSSRVENIIRLRFGIGESSDELTYQLTFSSDEVNKIKGVAK